MTDRLGRVAVFVGVVLVVVTAAAALGAVSAPEPRDTSVGYPNATDILPTVAEATDETSGPAAEVDERRVILVDDSHANRLDEQEYRPLVSALGPNHEVKFLRDSDELRDALSEADAYVVADPSLEFSTDEARAVESFVRDGGRLVVLGEPTRKRVAVGLGGATILDVRSRVSALTSRFGISVGTGYLYDERNNEGNYKRILADGQGPLDGQRAAFYTATTVRGGTPLLVTPETTRLSGSSAPRARPVAVTKGNVMVVGDTTFLTGGKDLVVDNERLVDEMARFALTGERTRTLVDYPFFIDREPSVRYTDAELLNATKSVAGDLREEGFRPTLAFGRAPGPDRTDVLVTTYDAIEANNLTWTNVTVIGESVIVSGYRGARENTTLVHQPEGTDRVVVAGPNRGKVEAVVRVLVENRMRAEAISETTIVVRNATNRTADDDDEGSGSGSGESGDGPTGPSPGPGLDVQPRAPERG